MAGCCRHAPGDLDPALSPPPGRSWRLWFQQTLTPGWKVSSLSLLVTLILTLTLHWARQAPPVFTSSVVCHQDMNYLPGPSHSACPNAHLLRAKSIPFAPPNERSGAFLMGSTMDPHAISLLNS